MKKNNIISQNNRGSGKNIIENIKTAPIKNQADSYQDLLDFAFDTAINKLSKYNRNKVYIKNNLLRIIDGSYHLKNNIENKIRFLKNVTDKDLIMCENCRFLNDEDWQHCDNCGAEKD